MAVSQSITIFPEVLRSIDSATFDSTFLAVGSPLVFPSRILKFTNASTVAVTLSWDGVHAAEYLPASSFVLLDVSANKQISQIFCASALTQFYASGTAGTGSFYISSYYAS